MERTSLPENYIAGDGILFMRPLTLEDSQLIVDWRNNPRVRAHYIYKEDFTLEGQRRYFHEKVETGRVAQFIFSVDRGKLSGREDSIAGRVPEISRAGKKEDEAALLVPIGCAVLDDIHPKYAECGNWIGEDLAVGRGYSPRMIRLACRYGFDVLHLEDIVARIFVDNPASIRSYERAGFHVEGILPDVESSDGARQDMLFLRARRQDYTV